MSSLITSSIGQVERIVDAALAEDLAWGDVTTDWTVAPGLSGAASLLVKGNGVVAGLEVAALVFRRVEPSLQLSLRLADGSHVSPGDVLGSVAGSVGAILRAERTALNFLQRLSGIATLTSRYVDAVTGLPVRVLDTRKTTPGLRLLEKYAVAAGGGYNHRMHLGDAVLIKDNHIAALRAQHITLRQALQQVREHSCHLHRVEVETTTLEEVRRALQAGADVILLDNMSVADMRKATKAVAGRVPLEASGNVTLDNIRQIAETGVDFISVGALTHSAPVLNISLELEL